MSYKIFNDQNHQYVNLKKVIKAPRSKYLKGMERMKLFTLRPAYDNTYIIRTFGRIYFVVLMVVYLDFLF